MSYSADWKNLISRFGYGSVDDPKQYEFIVKVRAYADMQPRTIAGLGEFRKNTENQKNLNLLLKQTAEKLHSFVINDDAREKGFDTWHEEICKEFVDGFKKILQGGAVDVNQITFGKAQKLINVSLKYIYCLKGAEDYKNMFEHCHMVLDRYTYSEGFYKQEVMKDRLPKTGLTPWSKLDDKEYRIIQKNIRDFLNNTTVSEYVDSDGKPLTPFQAEFYVFDKYLEKLNKTEPIYELDYKMC